MTRSTSTAGDELRVDDLTAEQRQASLDLVAKARQLMHAVAVAEVDVDRMRAAERALEEARQLLAGADRNRVIRSDLDGPARARAAGPGVLWRAFAHNPQALPLDIRFNENSAYARFTPDALHEGPPDGLQGGLSAYLLDVLLGVLLQALGKRAVTARLEMRYRRLTPLDVPLDLHARLIEVDGRKVRAEGWISHEGEPTVEARGLFVEVTG